MIKYIDDRLAAIEARLSRLEALVGSGQQDAAYFIAAEPAPSLETIDPSRLPSTPPPLPLQEPVIHHEVEDQAHVVADGVVLPYMAPPEPTSRRDHHSPWEQTIGLKWAGWIGALVLVIGAGLGIRYGYEQGWFNVVTPPMRVLLMSLAGLGLIGTGEWVFRKVNVISAAALFGAGVGTLFLVAYAGHGYYDLYGRSTAFTLMAAVTFVGAAVALRGRLLSIAVLSLIGGNLAPFVLGANSSLLGGFLVYLLMLQIVALALAWWGGSGRWWTLRLLSFATTGLWMLPLVLHSPVDRSTLLIAFTLIYMAGFQLELYLSARRAGSGDITFLPWNDAFDSGAVFSTLITAAGVGSLMAILRPASPIVQGGVVAVFSLAVAVAGLFLRRGNEQIVRLGKAYRVQSLALLVFAVPVTLSFVSVAVAWAFLAVAFAFTGRRSGSHLSRFAAAITWILAVCQLILWANGHRQTVVDVFTTAIPLYVLLASGLTLVGHLIASLVTGDSERGFEQWNALAPVLSATATAVSVVAALAAFSPAAATLLLIAMLWICHGLDAIAPRLRLSRQANGILALVTLKWAILDALAAGSDFSSASLPLINSFFGTALLIAGTIVLDYRRHKQTIEVYLPNSHRLLVLSLVGAVLMWAGTMEIFRFTGGWTGPWPANHLRQLALSAGWMTGLTTILYLARHIAEPNEHRRRFARVVGMLMLLVAAKALAIDLIGWRILDGFQPAMVLANVQAAAGAVVLAMLIVSALLIRDLHDSDDGKHKTVGRLIATAVLLALVLPTLEIDRAFEMIARGPGSATFTDPRLAKQVVFSIFWSLFAIGAIVTGFRWRIAGLRYFALALFAMTLLKVVVIDLSEAETGYRILSFIALGGLLLTTSVVYGKVSPRMLRAAMPLKEAA